MQRMQCWEPATLKPTLMLKFCKHVHGNHETQRSQKHTIPCFRLPDCKSTPRPLAMNWRQTSSRCRSLKQMSSMHRNDGTTKRRQTKNDVRDFEATNWTMHTSQTLRDTVRAKRDHWYLLSNCSCRSAILDLLASNSFSRHSIFLARSDWIVLEATVIVWN